jgi:hypothetical protein
MLLLVMLLGIPILRRPEACSGGVTEYCYISGGLMPGTGKFDWTGEIFPGIQTTLDTCVAKTKLEETP